MRAEKATFRDLVGLGRRTVRISAFQLEGDAIVALSPMLEATALGPTVAAPAPVDSPLFAEEILTRALDQTTLDPERGAWLALRCARPPLTDPAYAGNVERQPPGVYRVSRVDRYVDCPFKYFAESVLQLREDRDEASGLTPLERGTLVHALFERFYAEWQRDRRGAITAANMPEALARFADLAHDALARLPEADRAIEQTRLLGSIVGLGVAERVFELEADRAAGVDRRWLEADLRGEFVFPRLHGLAERRIELRGKVDRVDLLADGSIAVVDYKLGRLPDLRSSVQIAVYAYCVRQRLEAEDGRHHPIASATYLAFGDERRLEGSLGGASVPAALAVEARVAEFAAAIEEIESGKFPPRPKRPGECQWCGFAGVCRKEYQGEGDDAADAV
jgi:RecB family exonuclease